LTARRWLHLQDKQGRESDDDERSVCALSDSACSLQDCQSNPAVYETWLVQEYCGLGTLQVCLHTPVRTSQVFP